MTDIWFISDTHFFHDNMRRFTNEDGSLVRPGFDTTHHMNEHMIERWNSCVKPQDHIYHLGDVTMRYDLAFQLLMKRLNGHKRLCLGNHDRVKGTCLVNYFEKVFLWRPWNDLNFICSHIPLRKDQMRKRAFNVHGHIHNRVIDDPAYINVSVEVLNYTPIHLDEIAQKVGKL